MSTKIKLLNGGAPVVGAKLYIGEVVGTENITNVEGIATFDLVSGWTGYVTVYILYDETNATSPLLLKEGRTHEIDLGVIE